MIKPDLPVSSKSITTSSLMNFSRKKAFQISKLNKSKSVAQLVIEAPKTQSRVGTPSWNQELDSQVRIRSRNQELDPLAEPAHP